MRIRSIFCLILIFFISVLPCLAEPLGVFGYVKDIEGNPVGCIDMAFTDLSEDYTGHPISGKTNCGGMYVGKYAVFFYEIDGAKGNDVIEIKLDYAGNIFIEKFNLDGNEHNITLDLVGVVKESDGEIVDLIPVPALFLDDKDILQDKDEKESMKKNIKDAVISVTENKTDNNLEISNNYENINKEQDVGYCLNIKYFILFGFIFLILFFSYRKLS